MGLSLAKEKATVLSLKKALNDGRDFKMQVVMMLDVSGSMHDEFSGGKNSLMESVLQRSLAFASEVDPDGKVEMVAFSDTAYHMGEMDISAFDRATDTFLKGARPVLWGGTDYAAAFDTYKRANAQAKVVVEEKKPSGFFGAVKGLFGVTEKVETVVQAAGKDENYPTQIIFITDGENFGSKQRFISLLQEAANKFPEVDFVSASGIKGLNNDDFYKKLMTTELDTFLKKYYAEK